MSKMDRKIKRAFEKATPDVFDSVLGSCPANENVKEQPKRNTLYNLMHLSTAAALLVLVIGIGIMAVSMLNSSGANGPSKPQNNVLPPTIYSPVDNTDPTEITPHPTQTSDAFLLTELEARDLAIQTIQMNFPNISGYSDTHYTCEHLLNQQKQILYHKLDVTVGDERFCLQISSLSCKISDFQWHTNPDWEGVLLQPGILSKSDAWHLVSDYLNRNLGYGNVFTVNNVNELNISLGRTQIHSINSHSAATVYDISFTWADKEFSASVNAKSGDIISIYYDAVRPDTLLSKESAVQIAVAAFGCPQDGIHFLTDALLTEDASGSYWTVSFACTCQTHICRIDALSGNLLEKQSCEIIPGDIGMGKAQKIALRDAGIENQYGNQEFDVAVYLHSLTETRPYYFVEFEYQSKIHYYQIDAITGEIISREQPAPIAPTGIVPEIKAIKNALHAVGCRKGQEENLSCEPFSNEYTAPCYIISFDYNFTNHHFVLSMYTGEIINHYETPLPHQSRPELPPEIEQEIKTIYASEHEYCGIDTLSVDYYGQYGDVHVAFVWCECGYDTAIHTYDIGGYPFVYSNGNRLIAYKDGQLVNLETAYENGWFTADTIRELHEFYKDQNAYLYHESSD